MYEGDVVVDEERVVALVFEDLGGGDLHSACNVYCAVLYCTVLYYAVLYCTMLYCTVPALLRVLPHVVRAQHQLHAARPVRAVARRHHPLVRDQGAAAEPLSQRKYF